MNLKLKRPQTELKIISLLLKSKNTALRILPSIDKDIFSEKIHRHLFDVISTHWLKFMVAPKKNAIIESLKINNVKENEIDDYKIIIDKALLSEQDKADADYYVSKIVESYKARKLLKIVNSSLEMAEQGKVKDALQHVQTEIARIQYHSENKETYGDYVKDFEQRRKIILEKQSNPEKFRGIPIGIKQWDEYYGGVLPGEFGVVVGGTGVGKSIALMNFAASAWLKGYDVVFVTIEMSKLELEFRLDSRLSGINHRNFRLADLDKQEMEKWTDKIPIFKQKKNRIHIIDCPEGASTSYIEMRLMQLKDQLNKNFLLVVDYLNIMHSSQLRNVDDWLQQTYIARELKTLARSWNIGCWTAAQPKTNAVKQKFMVSEDTGRSVGIPQNANFVVGLIQTREDQLDNIMKFSTLKGRDGKCHDIVLNPDLSRMRLHLAINNNHGHDKKV